MTKTDCFLVILKLRFLFLHCWRRAFIFIPVFLCFFKHIDVLQYWIPRFWVWPWVKTLRKPISHGNLPRETTTTLLRREENKSLAFPNTLCNWLCSKRGQMGNLMRRGINSKDVWLVHIGINKRISGKYNFSIYFSILLKSICTYLYLHLHKNEALYVFCNVCTILCSYGRYMYSM